MILRFERDGEKVIALAETGEVIVEDKINSNYGRYFGKERVFYADCEVDNGMVLLKKKTSEAF